MVVTATLEHIYKYPVEMVFKCYNEKYNEKELKKHGIERVEQVQKKEDAGMECITRTISFGNFFPSLFQRMKALKIKEIDMEEECWSDIPKRIYWIRSRNITWQDNTTLAHSAFIRPEEHNTQWSRWEQESFIDFGSWGKFGTVLELYMKRHIEVKMTEEIKIIENKLASMKHFG